MCIYNLWNECFTPAGRAAAALCPLAMIAGMVPGFWAAWIFCGLESLLFLGTILSLFSTCKLNKVTVNNVMATPTFEGDSSILSATVNVTATLDCVQFGASRLDSSLKCEESEAVSISKSEGFKKLECKISTTRRGAFDLKKASANVPEIMGLLRWPFSYAGSVELLVYPRPIKIKTFSFLTYGASGINFAPLLMSSLTRGMNFVGVREYREGDSLRDLHHKAFARYGRPFTKEFEAERGAGAILVLDTTIPSIRKHHHLENAIRITAGIGNWLLDHHILGRFFIDNAEITLAGGNESRKNMMDALARIPAAKFTRARKQSPWSPAARPMDPVLRIGLFVQENPLVHKHIVVGADKSDSSNTTILGTDKILYLNSSSIKTSGISI